MAPSHILWSIGMGFLLLSAARSVAAEREVREFAVRVKGKPAGTYRMTITQRDDGTIQMEGEADVRVSFLVKTYKYTYRGIEVWKDGRLMSLASSTNDDGKRFTVQATSQGDGLHVTVNGARSILPSEVWTTTYWRLADAKYRDQVVPLIDADTGKYLSATLKYHGKQQISVAGQVQECTHYSLTGGGLQVKLWYDGRERLVREESIEDGHPYVLELTRIGQ
jgi:hypothetical protein